MYCSKCGKEIPEGKACPYCNPTVETKQNEKEISGGSNKIKKILKVICWLLIGIVMLTGLDAKSGMGTAKDGILETISYYLNIILIFVIPILVLMNFMGIRNKLPLFRKHKFLISVVAFLIMTMILGMACVLSSTAIDGLHSAEYRAEYEEKQELLKIEAEKQAEEETITEESIIESETEKTEAEVEDYNEVVPEDYEEDEEESYQEEILNPNEYADCYTDSYAEYEQEMIPPNEIAIYSMDYLVDYIDDHKIKIPKERYKSQMKKALKDDSEMIAVEISGSEKVRYSATAFVSEYYYVGKMKDNVPDGWGKIIRIVTAEEQDYYGCPIVDLDSTEWGVSEEDEAIPLLVYVGEFEDGYYSGYGWKYADPFEYKEIYEREIGYDYVKASDDIMQNILTSCNPIEYMGEFKKGLYDGEGVLVSYAAREIPFEMTAEDQMALTGVVADREIELFVGEFKKGLVHGEAKNYLLGKLLYDGEYKNGLYHGKGTLYYMGTNQKKYDGEWIKDEYHGKGTLYSEDGSVKYKGKWTMGDYAN